jgi:pimeloyl-ACP methyl ester carboxylesterase
VNSKVFNPFAKPKSTSRMTSVNKLLILFFLFVSFPACIFNKGTSHKQAITAKNSSEFKTKKGEKAYLKAYDSALTLWNEPFEEVDIKTSLGTAHIIICGPKGAPTLVLLHGLDASSTMWYPNIKSFSENYRVYSIDFILEPGKSVLKEKIKNEDDIIKWYNEIFDHFKFEKLSIVGASRGGWNTVNLALKSNHRIEKIVLLSPAMTITLIKPKRKVLLNSFFLMHPRRKRLRKILQTLSYNVDNIKQLFINQFYLASKNTKRNKGLLEMRPFSDKELGSIHIPVLLLIGDHDIFNNQKCIDKARTLIPHIEAGVIQNAGHFLSMDQAEVVNKRVMEFLMKNK